MLLLEQGGCLRAQDAERVAGNHQLFIGGDDEAGDARTWLRDAALAPGVSSGVNLKSEPAEALRHRFANNWRILPDACRKYEAVDAAHGGGEHAGEQRDAVDEI